MKTASTLRISTRSRVGTVSQVITADAEQNFYDFKDSSIPADLNFSDCRIPGEKATVIFQTGVMAGKEFDIEQTGDALTVFNDFDFTTEELSCMKARFDHINRNGMFTVETMDTYNKILEAYGNIDPEVRIKGMPHLQSAGSRKQAVLIRCSNTRQRLFAFAGMTAPIFLLACNKYSN
jgi:hypothetical protein